MNNNLDGEDSEASNQIFDTNLLLNGLISQDKFKWVSGPGLGWGDWGAQGTKLGKHQLSLYT